MDKAVFYVLQHIEGKLAGVDSVVALVRCLAVGFEGFASHRVERGHQYHATGASEGLVAGVEDDMPLSYAAAVALTTSVPSLHGVLCIVRGVSTEDGREVASRRCDALFHLLIARLTNLSLLDTASYQSVRDKVGSSAMAGAGAVIGLEAVFGTSNVYSVSGI